MCGNVGGVRADVERFPSIWSCVTSLRWNIFGVFCRVLCVTLSAEPGHTNTAKKAESRAGLLLSIGYCCVLYYVSQRNVFLFVPPIFINVYGNVKRNITYIYIMCVLFRVCRMYTHADCAMSMSNRNRNKIKYTSTGFDIRIDDCC